MDEGDTTT